ncbi:hypothetical protein POM88_053965 [Heracleum sosnowskyi]|uniref:Retrotransposon gag domain-containing protein n=1 Tax=Heracleum sosnowskyi TaxID=360622 RepID=A0AAD8GPF2_9APIA|nr:hypothetical protein POM88_053965 [Heracleum sosnowskyi]
MPTPEEQKAMILKWREERASKNGRQKKLEQTEKEAQARAKKREADLAKLEAIKRRRAELDAEEKALQDAVETGERTLMVTEQRKEKKVYNDEDESSDSESHPRRTRHKSTVRSDTDDERDPNMKDRLRRMEMAMFGDRRLKRKFSRHYSHLCRREKDTKALIHCRQRPDEELGDYLTRFKEEAGMVTNLDKVKAAGFLSAGLDPVKGKKLRSSLYDIPPKSLNDIYLWGESIRRRMESIGGYKDSRREDRGKKGRDRYESSRRYDDRRSDAKGRDKGVERRRDKDSTVFTPLNAPISKILHEIKGKPGFVRPARLKMPDYKKNGSKYCDYHKDKGHNTDECYHLKKLIEKMIKDGELNHFVKDLRDKLAPRKDKRKEPEDGERYMGELKTISGGSTLDRDSKTTKKRYVRQVYNLYQFQSAKQAMPIMFTGDDYEDVI